MRKLSSNAQLVFNIFDEIAKNNCAPFLEVCHDDVVGHNIDEGSWSGESASKQTIIDKIFRPLNRMRVERGTIFTRPVDGDDVIGLQAKEMKLTCDGRQYENDYVFAIPFDGGKIIRYEEYCDTELIAWVLQTVWRPSYWLDQNKCSWRGKKCCLTLQSKGRFSASVEDAFLYQTLVAKC